MDEDEKKPEYSDSEEKLIEKKTEIKSEHLHKPEHHHGHKSDHHGSSSKNQNIMYYKYALIAVSVLLLISLYFNYNGGPPGASSRTVSLEDASDKALTIINTNLLQPGTEATITKKSEESGLYKITLNIGGNEMDSYVSSDGKLLFPNAIELDTPPEPLTTPTTQPQVIEKSDKPEIELFVMSHCPYGTQAEKGLIPVLGALKDDIDFKLRFVNYAMHGEKEVLEQTAQYCIQKEQEDKFLAYLKCFLEEGKQEPC
ncbi:MAG: hypothetical protein V1740_05765 [Candidatus Woesearchaeota archaeon]